MAMTPQDHALATPDTGALSAYRRDRFDAGRDRRSWAALLPPCGTGSGGSAGHVVTVMIRWSSPYVIVRPVHQARGPAPTPDAERRTPLSAPMPTSDRVRELAAALSLNKSQLASVLRVTRPTIYSWLEGAEPASAGMDRIDRLCRLLEHTDASSTHPLNARFVRRAPSGTGPSLLDLLGADSLDEPMALDAIARVRDLDLASSDERQAKEARLQSAAFEPVDADRRRDQLAGSVALRDWPR